MRDINKVSFAEACNDRDGKTSGVKLGAFIALSTGCLSLIISTLLAYTNNNSAIAISATAGIVITASLGALGYNKKRMTKNE